MARLRSPRFAAVLPLQGPVVWANASDVEIYNRRGRHVSDTRGKPYSPQGTLLPQQTLLCDQKGKDHPRSLHLSPPHAQEVSGSQLIVKHHQHDRQCPVIIQGPPGGVIAKIGGQPVGHGSGTYRPAFPLQEEWPNHVLAPQDTEGIRLDGAYPSVIPKGEYTTTTRTGQVSGRVDKYTHWVYF